MSAPRPADRDEAARPRLLRRLFEGKRSLHVLLCVSLLSTIVPAGLCWYELTRIRHYVADVESAAQRAAFARELVNRVTESLFNFSAAALELSDDERRTVFDQTDGNIRALRAAVAAAAGLTESHLPADERDRLEGAIASFAHSWSEVRERFLTGMEPPEKAFHFLSLFDHARVARELLTRVERTATDAAEQAALSSIRSVREIAGLFLVVLLVSGGVGATALVGNHRYVAATRRANERLTDALEAVRERDRSLSVQNERFTLALGNMSQGLCMFDPDGRLIVCNGQYGALYGLPAHLTRPGASLRDILLHRMLGERLADDVAAERVEERLRLVRSGEPFTDQLALADGRVIHIVHRPMAHGGWVATHEDVTELRRAEAKIAHMAHHDALTGLPNRVLFRETLERDLGGLRPGEGLAVLCLDLDHFKAVNDTLGHPVGDALLSAVAQRLSGCLAPGDTLARLSGDEFAVIGGSDAAREAPSHLAQRLIDALAAPFELEGHGVVIGTSVGIALAPGDSEGADGLLKAADMALYRAKADGRGAYRFFEAEMDARMQVRRALEIDLRMAVANGGFEVHYQPLVDLATGRVSGFEALLRWPHPERGWVSPADFVPLAEEIGLIGRIGAWVLREACRQAATWPDDVRLAVNLSPVQFQGRTLVLDVVSALGASGLPARRLELEITETVMLQDTEATLAILHELRALGVRISMDDFGTGYSSLSYLRRFPFDKIKIDRSFTRDLPEGQDAAAIVKAVAGLGASLGMATTAEGVETEGQLAALRLEGCTEVQGFLFSPARPASEVPGLISAIAGRRAA